MIYYVKIGGIYCDHCRNTIIQKCKKHPDIIDCKINGNIATITGNITVEDIVGLIENTGYTTKEQWIYTWNKFRVQQIIILLSILFGIILFRNFLKWILGYDILNVIPTIDNTLSFGAIFLTGLFTGLHCIGMCGAINLVASTNKKNAILYNIGRILSYSCIGGIVGGIGNVLSFNKQIMAIFSIIIACVMLFMGIGMTGLFTFPLPHKCKNLFTYTNNSFLLGILNGFMPCGPLSAMQLYAMSTASPIKGVISMFLFGLGTVPFMMGFGMLQNIFKKKKEIIKQTMAVLIILLAISMIHRNLLTLGINFTIASKDTTQAEINTDTEIQEITTELTYSSYGDISVKCGIPVKFNIYANPDYLTGCNNEVISNDFGFDIKLQPGNNIIEFTPTEKGTFTYTCWMNMIKNTITVY